MDNPVFVERVFNAPVAKVWQALTDNEKMKKWYFNLPEFRAEVGFEFSFTGGPADGKQYLHLCKITQVEKEKKLAYSWRYDGYEGSSEVVFELMPEGETTRVTLTHYGLETFPASNPDLSSKILLRDGMK